MGLVKVKSVLKAVDILQVFTKEGRDLGVSEVAELVGMPKATVYRLVCTLAAGGLLEPSGKDKYRLGIALFEMGMMVSRRMNLRRLARPVMAKLRDEIDESVTLYVRSQWERVCIEMVESSQPLRHFTEVGRRLPLHVGAAGRVLLAYMEPSDIEEHLAILSNETPVDKGAFAEGIRRVKKDAHAISLGERVPGVSSVAAPIMDYGGRVRASLAISGPSIRFGDDEIKKYVLLATRAAQQISKSLGYQG